MNLVLSNNFPNIIANIIGFLKRNVVAVTQHKHTWMHWVW